ncbi:MAG: HPP family protein [Alphaproteobacteria bacterium]|jgi:CBS domain-containing membrane protein|nr:HPP family protein [Alphaproteobacteria bacterium]
MARNGSFGQRRSHKPLLCVSFSVTAGRVKTFFLPRQFGSAPALGWVRAMLGALFGIGITSLICRLWLGDAPASLPFLIAPIGASAVLVFALPASPLAQPWPVIGGNLMSATAGVALYHLAPDPNLAAGLAVATAIGAMALLRCLHPPGGAVALTAVIGGPAIHAAGFHYALVPVALNSAILVGLAWLFHKATHHSYPHRAAPTPPVANRDITAEDVRAALAHYEEIIDVNPDDLLMILRAAEAEAEARHKQR